MSDLNAPVTSIDEALAREYPPAVPAPCNDCPWRRNATPGWLGPYDAARWIQAAHGEGAIACHQTIPDGGGWGDQTRQCRGAAIFRANVCKSPVNPTIETGPPDRERVFASNDEFTSYHEGGDMDQDSRLAERVKRVTNATGYVEEEEAVFEHDGWNYGDRARMTEDNDDEGVFSGDEGWLVPCKVGAVEYGSTRTVLYFLADGMSSPIEVQPDQIEAA